MEIEIGSPLVLTDAKGLKKYGLVGGMIGWCNSKAAIEGDGTYVMFQPDQTNKFYWIKEDRLKVDEDRLPKAESE